MTASIRPMSAASSCSRKSGPVSTRIRYPSASTIIDALVLRFLGFSGSHTPQSLPIRGTPDDVPQPSSRTFISLSAPETAPCRTAGRSSLRSEEHTSELQSLMRISYAVFCLKKKKQIITQHSHPHDTTNHKH